MKLCFLRLYRANDERAGESSDFPLLMELS